MFRNSTTKAGPGSRCGKTECRNPCNAPPSPWSLPRKGDHELLVIANPVGEYLRPRPRHPNRRGSFGRHGAFSARYNTGNRFHGLTIATPHASKSAVLRVTTLAFRQ